ncbi:unnamed protein product [Gadus morhua 'NCC']
MKTDAAVCLGETRVSLTQLGPYLRHRDTALSGGGLIEADKPGSPRPAQVTAARLGRGVPGTLSVLIRVSVIPTPTP